jgi:hypothetical protein
MKKIFVFITVVVLSSVAAFAQKSGDELSAQTKGTKIKLTLGAGSDSSKLMGVGENFTDAEAKAAKVVAMNFAIGFFFPGQTLERAPDQIMLTFWIMSKKPQFAEKHSLVVYVGGDEIEVGDARYAAKAREDMEYLNFTLSRDLLIKLASAGTAHFKLGDATFAFSREHLRMFADLAEISDPMSK